MISGTTQNTIIFLVIVLILSSMDGSAHSQESFTSTVLRIISQPFVYLKEKSSGLLRNKKKICAQKAAVNFNAKNYTDFDTCAAYVGECHGKETLQQFQNFRANAKDDEGKNYEVANFCKNMYTAGM